MARTISRELGRIGSVVARLKAGSRAHPKAASVSTGVRKKSLGRAGSGGSSLLGSEASSPFLAQEGETHGGEISLSRSNICLGVRKGPCYRCRRTRVVFSKIWSTV
jgi:hypothetical protein